MYHVVPLMAERQKEYTLIGFCPDCCALCSRLDAKLLSSQGLTGSSLFGHVWVSLLKQLIDLLASWKSQDFVTY
ncbi:hypothetical protein Hanom_Chr05g00408471 [Helianthus anomalus]